MAKNPYSPTGQKSGFNNIMPASRFSPVPPASANTIVKPMVIKQQFDTKVPSGAVDITEQFKGIQQTGFTPGSVMFQQRLRLMFIQLVQSGMSHKDAAKHIQATTGFHARTGQKLDKKLEFKGKKKIKYAGEYSTKKHYKTRAVKRKQRHTPAGIK